MSRSGDRVGLYATVIFHLVVVGVLLGVQVGYSLVGENAFVMDFSAHEEREQVRRETEFREDISERIDRMLAESESGAAYYRNVSVDRGALKDDRGTDAGKLYEDAERLRQALSDGLREESPGDYADPVPEPQRRVEDKPVSDTPYSGPSVVSYELGGRKASHLDIPAYRCMGAGMVTVIITVDNAGRVVNAKIQEELSSEDSCLRDFAVRAARRSRFSSDPSAPARQTGNIVYQFIAQ